MKLFKNKELKYKYEKNKSKILTIVAIVVAFITLSIVGVEMYINRPIQAPPDEQIPDEIVQEADYIINGTKDGDVSLIRIKDNKIASNVNLSKDTIYARSNDLDYVMAFTDNTFYKVYRNDETLQKEELVKLDKTSINSFKFSDKYIVAISDDKVSTISLLSKKVTSNNIISIDKYTVYENYFIYAIENNIYTLNMDTNETKSMDIGDKTKGLFVMNGKIVDFSNFGSGNNTNMIIRFKPNDLYLEKEYTHNNKLVNPLTPDSDDLIIPYIDNLNKNNVTVNAHYRINMDKDGGNKRQITLPTTQDDNSYSEYNTVSTKGYMYSTRNSKLEITNFESQKVVGTIDNYKDGFFMPILDMVTDNK